MYTVCVVLFTGGLVNNVEGESQGCLCLCLCGCEDLCRYSLHVRVFFCGPVFTVYFVNLRNIDASDVYSLTLTASIDRL